jgi:hypothetical protein
MKNKIIKTGDFSWMGERDCEKSRSVSKAMRATKDLVISIGAKGITRKPFQGYK